MTALGHMPLWMSRKLKHSTLPHPQYSPGDVHLFLNLKEYLVVYNKENLERQETNKSIWKEDGAALT